MQVQELETLEGCYSGGRMGCKYALSDGTSLLAVSSPLEDAAGWTIWIAQTLPVKN